MKKSVDVQKRFLIYRMYPKYLAAHQSCRCDMNAGFNNPSNGGCSGNNPGGLVTCEFPLRIESASRTSLESFTQFTSFCSSWSLPDNSIIIFWSSMNFFWANSSKVEFWNFCNSFCFIRTCWWTSRKSCCCRNNSSCRILRSCSAWAARSSWWRTFSPYSAIIVLRCSSNIVLICALELSRSSATLSWADPQFDWSFFWVVWLKETDSEHFSSFGCHKKIDHCCFSPQQVSLFYRPQLQDILQAHRRRRQGRWEKELYRLGCPGSRYRWRPRGSAHWCLRAPCPWDHNLCRVWHSPEWPCSRSWSRTGDLPWNSRQAPWQESGRGGRRTGGRSRERRKRTLKQPRAHAWMGWGDKTRTRPLIQMWRMNACTTTHLNGARIVLNGAWLARLCESWRSCSWDCAWSCTQCSVAFLYHKMFVNIRYKMYCIYTRKSEETLISCMDEMRQKPEHLEPWAMRCVQRMSVTAKDYEY